MTALLAALSRRNLPGAARLYLWWLDRSGLLVCCGDPRAHGPHRLCVGIPLPPLDASLSHPLPNVGP